MSAPTGRHSPATPPWAHLGAGVSAVPAASVDGGRESAALHLLLWLSPFAGLRTWSVVFSLALPALVGWLRLTAWTMAGLTVLAVWVASPAGLPARRWAPLAVALALEVTVSGPLTIQAVDAVWRHLSEVTHG